LEDEFYDFIEIYGYVSLPEGIVFLGFMFDDDDDDDWLVVWNHGFFFDFPYGNFIIPTDEVILFREVETTKQFFFRLVNYCMI